MKEETIYVCEICGCDYETKKDALKCENNHVKAEEIIGFCYRGHSEIPSYIDVKMSDGRVVKYCSC